jgi:hypothetical protein
MPRNAEQLDRLHQAARDMLQSNEAFRTSIHASLGDDGLAAVDAALDATMQEPDERTSAALDQLLQPDPAAGGLPVIAGYLRRALSDTLCGEAGEASKAQMIGALATAARPPAEGMAPPIAQHKHSIRTTRTVATLLC